MNRTITVHSTGTGAPTQVRMRIRGKEKTRQVCRITVTGGRIILL